MGWGDSAEARRAATRGPTPPVPPPSPGPAARVARQKRRSGATPLLVAAAAAAVLLPVAQHLGWLDALKRTLRRAGVRLPWRGGEDDEDDDGVEEEGEGGGTRSAFRFPKGAQRSKNDPASSLPRTAQGKNKKGKSRKAAVREERAQKREEKASGVYMGKAGGVGTLPEPSAGGTRGNNVPRDEDILGGEAGKTFTTNTSYVTSAMYKRIREERGE